MPTKSPRTFTREFKLDLCRQIQSGQKRPAQLCREYQIAEGLLLRWRREFQQRGEAAFSAKDIAEVSPTALLEQKAAELERFCGQLSLENSILTPIKPKKKHRRPAGNRAVRLDHAGQTGPPTSLGALALPDIRRQPKLVSAPVRPCLLYVFGRRHKAARRY